MRTVLPLLIAMLSFAGAKAQSDTLTVKGQVRCADEPLEACIVSLLNPADSSIVAYAMTDERGYYTLKAVSRLHEVLVRVTGFNVKKQIKRVAATTKALDFAVQEENVTLREVQVKARKLWGSRDTLNYLVSAYTRDHDRTIGDVLRQLPGISIEDNGVIKYQGTPINHFYIENLDMLQGRYNLATEGIKAEDVATVQVLENHEHVKALQDQVPPESAAINLRLKDKAKGVWSKSADVGAGVYGDGGLWSATLQAMYFSKNAQHLLRYCGDDLGRSIDAAASHYGLSSGAGTSMVGVLGHGTSSVGNSLFGYRHGVNLNNLAKLSKDATLNYNFNYGHNYTHGNSFSRTTYILPDGSNLLLTEDIADRTETDAAELQLTYERNAERHFLNNTLSLSGKWNEGRGTVLSDGDIQQASHYRSLSLSNRTRWVHRTAQGGGFDWTSTNSLTSTPQALAVGGNMEARQDVDITELSTANSFELLRDLTAHKWTLSASAQFDATYTSLSSTLTYPDVQEAVNGDMYHLNVLVGIGPVARYVNGSFHASLGMPIVMTYTHLDNTSLKEEQTDAERTHLRWQPNFTLLWKANSRFTIDADARYTASETPWQQLLTAYVMKNYRSLSRYRATLSDSYGAGAKLKVSYKDVFNSLFAHLQGEWNRSWSDIAYGTTLDEQAHTVVEASVTPNHHQEFTLRGYARKDFDWHTSQLEINASASRGHSELLRQSVLTEYRTTGYSLGGTVALDIVRGYRLEYTLRWNRHVYATDEYRYTYNDLWQQAKFTLRLVPSKLFLKLSADHTHNSSLTSARKDYVFVGAGLRYNLSKVVELNLDGDNLTNIHTFTTHTVGDMEQYYAQYRLRSRSVMLTAHITF